MPGHGYDLVAWTLGANFFRGLLRIERGLDIVPDLAERVSVSTDGCRYVFRLRKGLRWSDGAPLTADDFAFTYRTMREEAVASANLLAEVEAQARDDVTLELRLPEPGAHMLYLFAQFPFFPWPRHKVEELGAEWHRPASRVCNGPFVITEVDDEKAVAKTNSSWYGPRGNVGKMTFSLLDFYDAVDAWNTSRFDFLFVPNLARVGNVHDTAIVPVPVLSLSFVAFPARAPF